ncbi:MAG: hypothetical protein KAJ73_09015 [Zetaproteobacteria bacterium]|nr:hypothetical protein [Zetaproteobacteria bacterium]
MHEETCIPVVTYPVERYKGRVEVSLRGEDGMHVRSDHHFPLFVNGVKIYFNVTLQEYDGEWELVRYTVRGTGGQYPDWSALTVRRLDNGERASDSAHKKVLELATDLAQWVSESRPDDVILGEIHRLRRKHDILSDEKITLNARLSQVQDEMVDLFLAIEGQKVRWAQEVALLDEEKGAKRYGLEGGSLSLEVTSHL